jgi:7,8-dihydropterin-6-yl-methyl-4-(beta-D-ribofuranosyl)aminobenzene 5'-phosphate synthase
MSSRHTVVLPVLLVCALSANEGTQPQGAGADSASRITVLYDAFGPSSELEKDWGFAALVEYAGKRVLFDTGNNAGILERNVARLKVDLTRLDAAVISHRHGDHTTGLGYLLQRNPGVKIYAPQEGAFFKSSAPPAFFTHHPGLPQELRYVDPPHGWTSGTPWPQANFQVVTATAEILPGFHVLTTQSRKPGTMEMNEVSLAIRTSRGLVVVVGCSHPGVEAILAQAATIDARLYMVTGGLHLVMTPREEVDRVAGLLRDRLKVERVAPGHCTSELGFAVFLERFNERFDKAGVGATISLP